MDIIEVAKNLSVKLKDIAAVNIEEKLVLEAANSFLNANEVNAELLCKKLLSESVNEDVKSIANNILYAIYIWNNQINRLVNLGFPRADDEKEAMHIYNESGIEYLYGEESCNMMLNYIPGLPIMEVYINNVKLNMVMDTGALYTCIAEEAAIKCGISMDGEAGYADTPEGGNLVTLFSEINEIQIGNHMIKNKLGMILPSGALSFQSINEEYSIDGLIGWEIIKHFKCKFDYKNKKIYMKEPKIEEVSKNMCCDFFPMVKVICGGENCVVSLDTGATKTYFGKCMKDRVKNTKEKKIKVGSVAGISEISISEIDEINLVVDGFETHIYNSAIFNDNEYSSAHFFLSPGTVGSDIGNEKTMIIDYHNRHFELHNS